MIRTFLAAFFLSGYTLILGPPLILHAFLAKRADVLYRMGVGGVVFIVKALGAHIRVEGLENIPGRACLFVANHTSTVDAPAIVGAIPRQIALLAKQSLFKIPIVGQAFLLARFVPVDRSNRDAAVGSVAKAIARLREGTSFLIYPEGTRSNDGRLQEFKKGAFVMAIKAQVPIVPVACAGAHKVMRKRDLKFYPGEIVVRFCPPIESSSYSLEQRDALSAEVHASLAAGLPVDQRPLEAAAPGTH
jgi:1-acyl-sn-glycerol-3-phosphate acyltransferase